MKFSDPEQSDFSVDFAMILCGPLCLVSYKACIHKLASFSYVIGLSSRLTSRNENVNIL